MKLSKIALGLVLLAMMVPLAFAPEPPPPPPPCEYTPGYWKRCVTKYVTMRGSYPADMDEVKESDGSMEAYEDWIQATIESTFTLEWAYDEFWMRGPGRQPIRQMIADWFNLAKAAILMVE